MEFRILGPIEALSKGEPLQLGGARQRSMLAYLLLHADSVVSADRLLDELWADAPSGGSAAVQTQVSRLRKTLGDRITTSGRGYELHVEPGELDLERFRTLLAEAGATVDPSHRSALLRQADGLWRGEALSGLDAPFVAADAAALEELRLGAIEERLEADLGRGLDGELVPELSTLVSHYPLRERLRGQLILALYRSGRQADALEAYRETRRVLAEELGLDPSPALRELEKAILRHDENLGARGPAVTTQAAHGQPRTGHRRRAVLVVVSLGLVCAATATAILAIEASARIVGASEDGRDLGQLQQRLHRSDNLDDRRRRRRCLGRRAGRTAHTHCLSESGPGRNLRPDRHSRRDTMLVSR
jgi:DNA-binding SARP family transcriptional activator